MPVSLPMASDMLRNEGNTIREAADRAASQMAICRAAVQDAHAKIRTIQGGLELLLAAIHADDPKRELLVRVGDLMREARDQQLTPTKEPT